MNNDPNIKKIVEVLKTKYKCHSALLYGSRARGAAGPTSDYDVVGICSKGSKTRFAKKIDGVYWDLFVYPETELKKLSGHHMDWRNAKVLFEKGAYGRRLAEKVQKLIKKPFKPDPQYEIDVTIAWAEKQLDRIAVGDTHGLFRRTELQNAAIGHYFQIRRKRFWGPRAGLQWLKENDPSTYRLFAKVYRNPTDMKALNNLVARVYGK